MFIAEEFNNLGLVLQKFESQRRSTREAVSGSDLPDRQDFENNGSKGNNIFGSNSQTAYFHVQQMALLGFFFLPP